jgi:hypothetical protein
MGCARLFTLWAGAFLVACAAVPDPRPGTVSAEMKVVGPGAAEWPEAGAAANPNFVWEYETVGRTSIEESALHSMKTSLRLVYDPAAMTVRGAAVQCSGQGRSFRHVCLTPAPDGRLSIRITTLFDRREEDFTAVKIHGPDPATHTCDEYGVGPKDGLVEGVEVVFHPDGSFRALPGTGAHLAGRGLAIRRAMTQAMDDAEKDVAEFR